ncbi:winged helix-turn-helix transcriptional regulator [Paraburkholderia fungorum]|uniref:DNA-binding HxlR family transcriptional regulator n=1 Tax=Paraburkholderia fungorum TaxID=134537 RepID=A0AAW3US45_9BURK|nr:helix-turn-helix domain-containing protein [Paraburkholderia fungorum]MBB4513905.1 DNA-binding HxlR family transcriptional regulator [Paraburkholderia fungorum]MBB6201146.1 DNA-binding HxlR family transcriptional regulator [Paraburkholderia fungorum]
MKSAPRASDVLVDAVGNCPLDLAIRTIGGKWKLLILRVLFLSGGERYNNLLRVIPDISPKKLTRNLRELEDTGLVIARQSDGYALSPLGLQLEPALKQLGIFGRALSESGRG